MRPALLVSIAILLAATAPALAVPACSGSFWYNPERVGEARLNEYNLTLLQRNGIDATRAEIWGGCIRAWVRVGGREEMQFFEPLTLQRVE